MERMTISRASAALSPKRAGFTLTELLVVIGIIVLLASIGLPLLIKSVREGSRARQAADFQAISAGLEAYKTDFGAYPLIETGGLRGSAVLCRALIAPGSALIDGADGLGFKAKTGGVVRGQTYGPYLQADKFKLKINAPDLSDAEIYDLWSRNAIMYYPARPAVPNIRKLDAANRPTFIDAGAWALFNYTDNDVALITKTQFCYMLGDDSNNGLIDGTETARTTGPYVLWSSGPDKIFGSDKTIPTADDVTKSDDVTNFTR